MIIARIITGITGNCRDVNISTRCHTRRSNGTYLLHQLDLTLQLASIIKCVYIPLLSLRITSFADFVVGSCLTFLVKVWVGWEMLNRVVPKIEEVNILGYRCPVRHTCISGLVLRVTLFLVFFKDGNKGYSKLRPNEKVFFFKLYWKCLQKILIMSMTLVYFIFFHCENILGSA